MSKREVIVIGKVKLTATAQRQDAVHNDEKEVIGYSYLIYLREIDHTCEASIIYDEGGCANYEGPEIFEELVTEAHDNQ